MKNLSPSVPFLKQKQWLFDQWAPRYDWLLPSIFYQAVHQRLLEFVEMPEAPAVLDLGCGTGRLLNRLAVAFPDLQGTGLDLSAEMVRQARLKNQHHPRLIFLQGNAAAMPFVKGQFDAVFNTISFLHYPDPVSVLSEVKRVLHPDGRYYLADFAPSRWIPLADSVNLPSGVRFYPAEARAAIAAEAELHCLGHHYLLGPVLLTILGHIPV